MSDNDKMREAMTAATKIVTNPHGYTETSVLVAKAFLEQASQAEQSVPVVGDVVEWQYRWLNPDEYKDQPASLLQWERVVPRLKQSYEKRLEELLAYRSHGKACYEIRALIVQPTHSITTAELERMRKDEELKASEASIACEALQEIIDLLPGSSVAQAKLIAVAAMTKRAAIAAEGEKECQT